MAARILVLYVFDRGEWPEIWHAKGRLMLIDLVFLIARFASSVDLRRARLDDYRVTTPDNYRQASVEAARCGVTKEFHQALDAFRLRLGQGEHDL